MEIIKENIKLADFCNKNRQNGQKMALVPTMGALHEGHLRLVEEGLEHADICLPYIFLNPTQFAEGEDLDQYPQTLEQDLEKLERLGIETVWVPLVKEIYPNGIQITHKADDIAKPLEGEFRPHFFDGVVTVLHRMFDLPKPDYVMMGEKDFQQLQVTRAMAKKYFPDIEIIGVKTMRDENGLALSSRNVYLSDAEYKTAIQLNKIMREMARGLIDEKHAIQKLLEAGFDKIDYCTARNSQTFKRVNPDRILIATYLGKTRLIDNTPLIES